MLLKNKTKAGFSDSTNRIRCYFYSLFALFMKKDSEKVWLAFLETYLRILCFPKTRFALTLKL